jgi:hypothetical protein
VKSKFVPLHVGTLRGLIVSARAWENTTAQVILLGDGMKSMKLSQFLGEYNGMPAVSYMPKKMCFVQIDFRNGAKNIFGKERPKKVRTVSTCHAQLTYLR